MAASLMNNSNTLLHVLHTIYLYCSTLIWYKAILHLIQITSQHAILIRFASNNYVMLFNSDSIL